jgi:hypothetical protein
MFDVTQGGLWFEGYWWWVCASGQDTTPAKCALWQVTGGSSEVIVPGSVVTSGTLTAGQWNFVPLSAPVPLAPCSAQSYGAVYLAAVGYSASDGFPETKNQFGSGGTYSAGITNGPLNAPSSSSGSAAAGSAFGGWAKPQMAYTVAGSDPSVIMPGQNDSDANFWVDVQVSDTAPSGASYQGFSAAPAFVSPGTSASATAYTLGLEFTLSAACTLQRIWHYSPAGSTVLPSRCAVWNVSTQAVVSGTDNTSPSWLKQADGSAAAAGDGWVYCDYSGSAPALSSGVNYKAATFTPANTSPWFLVVTGWWGGSPGPFSSGLTAGPLTILGNSVSTQGQDSWNAGTTWTYPATGNIVNGTESPEYDGIDVQVTPAAGAAAASGTLNVSGTAAGRAPAAVAGALDASGAFTLAGTAAGKAPAGAAGVLAVSGSAAAAAPVTPAGALNVSGTGAGQAPAAAASSITLAGTAAGLAPAAAAGGFILTGAATAAPGTGVAGALALSASAGARAPAAATGAFSLAGTAALVPVTPGQTGSCLAVDYPAYFLAAVDYPAYSVLAVDRGG